MSETPIYYSARFVYNFNQATLTQCIRFAVEFENEIGNLPAEFLLDGNPVRFNEADAKLLMEGSLTETQYYEKNKK